MRRVAIAGALLGVAGLAACVVFRRPLAETALLRAFARAGFAEATLSVDRVSWGDLVVTSIDAGEGLRIERVRLIFDLFELPNLPVTAVEASGARIDLESLERTSVSETTGATRTPSQPAFPGNVPTLDLEDVHVRLPTPFGVIEIDLAARADLAGESRITFDAMLEGALARAVAHGEARLAVGGDVSGRVRIASLSASDPRLTIASGSAAIDLDGEVDGLDLRRLGGRLDSDLSGVRSGEMILGRVEIAVPFSLEPAAKGWRVSIDGARTDLAGPAVRLSDAHASATVPGPFDVEVQIGRLEDTSTPKRFAPTLVSLSVPEIGESIEFRIEASPAGGGATVVARGRFEPSTGKANAKLEIPRTRFEPKSLQPSMLSPFLRDLEDVRGTVEAGIDVSWNGRALSGTGTVALDELSFRFEGTRIEGLSASLALESLTPPTSRGPQRLEVGRIASGVAVENVRLGYVLVLRGTGAALEIDDLEADLLGGTLAIDHAVLDPVAESNEVSLRLDRLDVARLFEALGVSDVSGTGALSGRIPVRLRASVVAIDEGRLEAEGPGVLRIRSEAVARALAGQGESVDLLVRALRDFHYESLAVTVAKSERGEARVAVHLRGNNPDVLEGYPFALNVNLTGNVDRLVGSLAEILRLADRAVRSTVPSR